MTDLPSLVWGGVDLSGVSPPSDPASPHDWSVTVLGPGPSTSSTTTVEHRCARCGFAALTSASFGRPSSTALWVQSVRRLDVLARCDEQLARGVMEG